MPKIVGGKMKISAIKDILNIKLNSVIGFIFSDQILSNNLKNIDNILKGKLQKLIDEKEIKGEFNEITVIHTEKNEFKHIILVGAGNKKEFNDEKLRCLCSTVIKKCKDINSRSIGFLDVSEFSIFSFNSSISIIEGILLGSYKFDKYLTKKNDFEIENIYIETKDIENTEKGIERSKILSKNVNFTKDIVNEPANIIDPITFSELALKISKENNIKCTIYNEKEILEMKMEAFSAVARAGDKPARMIVMEYNGDTKGSLPVYLVGKGITFDAGGLNIKTGHYLNNMKCDMTGAAVVLGVMKAAAELKVKRNIVGLYGMCENMLSSNSYKVGDILRARNGKTIEVMNTDAEGRLVLADLLSYASENKCRAVIDIATLTGGIVTALGHGYSGIMGNNKELINNIISSGNFTGENIWELPLPDEYKNMIESKVADIKNLGGAAASSITAGLFLKEFSENVSWAHIDIVGTAFIYEDVIYQKNKTYLPDHGATGVIVRTLVRYLETLN